MNFENVKKITVFSESGKPDESIKYIKVEYKDNKEPEKIEGFEKCRPIVSGYASYKGILLGGLTDKESEELEVKKVEKEEAKPKESDFGDEEEEKDKPGKKRMSKGAKATLSIITALTIATAGIIHFFKKNDNGYKLNVSPKSKIEKIMTEGSNYVPLNVKPESDYENIFRDIYQAGNMEEKMIRIVNFEEMSPKEFYNNLDDFNIYLGKNITEVCELLEGGKMSGQEFEIHLETLFDKDKEPNEYEAAKYFSDLRNNIVHNAYKQDSGVTEKDVKAFLNPYIDLCANKNQVMIGDRPIIFNGLNPMARYSIGGLGANVAECPVEDYKYIINGKEITKREMNDVAKEIWGTSTSILEDSMKFSR